MVIWPLRRSPEDNAKIFQVLHAIHCVLDLLECCGHYEETLGGTTVTLNLHCAISAGELHCMCLGNESRMEFLIAGEQFQELTAAEGCAGAGQLCLAPGTHQLVRQGVMGRVVSDTGIFLVDALASCGLTGHTCENSLKHRLCVLGDSTGNVSEDDRPCKRRRHSSLRFDSETGENIGPVTNTSSTTAIMFSTLTAAASLLKRGSQRHLYSAPTAALDTPKLTPLSESVMLPSPKIHLVAAESDYLSEHVGENKQTRAFLANIDPSHPEEYERLLERFVHESARLSILHRTTEHLSELRVVVTMFVHLTNLDSEFNLGDLERPQSAMLTVLEVMHALGGTLRQFVVDDKGCVLICCFGVPGYSSHQDDVKALYSALCIRQSLQEEHITCRIGMAKGLAYCGYVGCAERKEYCVMGSSVNLAARLMGKALVGQILVNGGVYLRGNGEFSFEKLPKIQAKGYSSAVPVYLVKHLRQSPSMRVTLQQAITNIQSTRCTDSRFIGRGRELQILQDSVSRLFEATVEVELSASMERAGLPELYQLGNTDTVGVYTSCNTYIDDIDRTEQERPSDNASDDSPVMSAESSNKFVISGIEGVGKTVLIRECLDRNKLALQYTHEVSCHVANMLEPYETIRQLLKSIFLKTAHKGPNNYSVSSEGGDWGEITSGGGGKDSLFDDDVKFEVVYSDLCEWATDHLTGVTIDLAAADIEQRCSREDASQLPKTDTEDPSEYMQNIVPISVKTVSIGQFFLGETSGQRATSFQLVDLLPLLRLVLDTRTQPPVELMLAVTQERLSSTLQSIIVELLSSYIEKCGMGAMVVENVQWADRLSFNILRELFLRHSQGVLFLCSFRTATSFGRKVSYLRADSFEGGVVLNSLDEMADYSRVLPLGLLSKAEVKLLLESVLGPDLISSVPNVLSDSTVQSIYSRSGNGVASNVMKLAKELEASVSVKTFDAHAGQLVGALPVADTVVLNKFDELSLESQVVLKTASVCGTNFTRSLLMKALAQLGYNKTICTRIDPALGEIEDAGLIRRVSGAEYAPDGSFSPATIKRRNLATDAMNKTFSFTEKHFSDSIYSVMLEKQRQHVHTIIASLIEEARAQSGESLSCNTTELLAFHYSRARNIEMEARYTELAAQCTGRKNMLSVSFNYYHHVLMMASGDRTVEQLMRDACSRPGNPSLYSVTVRNLCAVAEAPLSRHYIDPSSFVQRLQSTCPYISDTTLSDVVAEMSRLKYK